MGECPINIPLIIGFFAIAIIYSMVGFAGGSSYTALLALVDTPYKMIAPISLLCNIVVATGNSINFIRAREFNGKIFWPLAIASIPFAYIGGKLPVSKEVFLWTLCAALLLSGLKLLFEPKLVLFERQKSNPIILGFIGAILGLLAGITGIGGGIFLAPILYFLRYAPAKQIAATASLFILVNSISGLIGQLQKNAFDTELLNYWYLPMFVLIGGQIGNLLNIKKLNPTHIAKLSAILVIYAAINIAIKQLN